MLPLIGLLCLVIQIVPCVDSCAYNQTYGDNFQLNKTISRLNNGTDRKYAYLYMNLRVYFLKWYLPFVVGVGSFGTVFCLVFLFLSRLFPANMLLWLVSICVGDFLILVMEGIWMLLKVWLNYDIRDINNVACVLHTSFSNYLYYWSAYMQCMLSMQRAYLIIRPLRARGSGPNMKWLAFVWTSISVLLVIPMLPYPLYWRVIDGDCDPPRESLFRITTLSDFIIWSLIPLIGMTSATAIICWNIFRIRRSFQSGGITAFAQNNSSHSTLTYVCPPTRSSLPNRMSILERDRLFIRSSRSQNRITNRVSQQNKLAPAVNARNTMNRLDKTSIFTDNTVAFVRPVSFAHNNQGQRHGSTDNAGHVTRLLICMNIWYMISTYPLMIYLMFLNFITKDMDRDIHKFMYYLSRSLCFLNSCSNWIFYCASGRLFRQRIKQICRRFVQRLFFYSGSQSSGFNDNHGNFARNTSHAIRDKYTMVVVNDAWGKRTSWIPRKVLSAENLHLRANSSFPQLSQPETSSAVCNAIPSRFVTWIRKICYSCQAFQCRCFCTKPLPFIVHSMPADSRMAEDETRDSLSHGTVFGPRTTVASEHVCECEACCTGFCCWKFWWYGFSGGLMKKESVFTAGGMKDQSKCQSFGMTSSSSSLYFHSEMARHNSHLRMRPKCLHCNSSYHSHLRPQKQQWHPLNLYPLRHSHQHHLHHHHRARHAHSENRLRDLEATSSCGQDSKISRGLQENKLPHEGGVIRSKQDLYGSAPSSLVHPSHGCVGTATPCPHTQLTIHNQPANHERSQATNSKLNASITAKSINASNDGSTVTSNPVCYCYMSSLGKRRYHYHVCKLHEKDREKTNELPGWYFVPHHPFALSPLHSAHSEGRILHALEGNRNESLSLPPVRQHLAKCDQSEFQSLG
ncbi:Rhodopsin orphan GPCR [Fasciola hepatica]|uniref:Rhodopsin orphan GPCR n=1 Tax=Fasciola hepatica TaxID=6192 RepID=A0A4E0RDS9_FASHE|nr:Rhodopsin orphan GPCR [Fasciola hepatica]